VPDLVCCGTEKKRKKIVTYGAESWTLTIKMKTALMTWERKIMRKIYGPKYQNGFWGTKMN
jgi:hypothetical protein